ncbi:MAG: 1-deoxy-D-xylulose-5-phosphate synthase [Clostridiales bacterium]|nr:1-deoxy-D-xylulose-5-phosphate synthase [Clostridiales bacterium]
MGMLENVKSPADIKELKVGELKELAAEIRREILNTTASNGGHLSSNLGIVEATLALHKVFDSPDDRIIFDVSHQSYVHKLLTGRYDKFSTLRKSGGISGFSNPAESEHDPCVQGHCGSSLSEALAFAVSDSLDGKENYTVAVVGDGAFTNGMIYEALNNCAEKNLRLIILLNDNEMSISKNIGGMNNSFRRMRSSAGYFRFKHGLQRFLRKIPLLGKAFIWLGRKTKNAIKNIVLKKNMFENLGLQYIGPVDGNDVKRTCSVLAEAKRRNSCCVVHIYTKKGLGYPFAEAEPEKYHSVSPFDIEKGICGGESETYSNRFGKFMSGLADRDKRVCAITAAMGAGTGLTEFEKNFPDRFFDVGIAEEHAVTFGAGLAAAGKLPVCAIYSTFAQRAYDQLFQDVALNNLHFILALDRCGFVEGDGVTHQGIFDYSLFSTLPEVTIYSPATFPELDTCMQKAADGEGLQIVRYPKGREMPPHEWLYTDSGNIAYTEDVQNKQTVIVTYGRIAANAYSCISGDTGIVRLVRAFPFDLEELNSLTISAKNIYLLEEGIYEGGMAQKLLSHFIGLGKKVCVRALHNFVEHGSLCDLFAAHGFAPEQIAEELKKSF